MPLTLERRVELMGRGKAKNTEGRHNFYSVSSVLFKFFNEYVFSLQLLIKI